MFGLAFSHYPTLKFVPVSQVEGASAYLPPNTVETLGQRAAKPIIVYLRKYLNHYVNTGQSRRFMAKRFANQPFEPVTPKRFRRTLLCHYQAQARAGHSILSGA